MTEPPEPPGAEHADTAAAPTRVPKWVGFAVGLLLVAGAAAAISQSSDDFARAWGAMHSAPWWQWAALPASMLGSLMLTSAVFWILTSAYGTVRLSEMSALIGMAWVMNYLPMHPGMFGRIAYHKKYNNIRARDTMKATIVANVQTLVCIVLLPAIAYASAVTANADERATFAALNAPSVLFFALGLFMRAQKQESWRFWTCLGIRCFEVQLWALRYWLSFAIIGMPIPFSASVLLAGAVIVASMVALTGNGMGVQEWAVALVAPILPAALLAGGLDHSDGLIGAFVSRAFEVIAALVAGLWGAWFLARYRKNNNRERP